MKNDANFAALDKLISEGGVDLKTFLENNPAPVLSEAEEEEVKEEPEAEAKEPSEQVRRDANIEGVKLEETTEVICEKQVENEVKEKTNREEEKQEHEDENKRIVVGGELSEQKSPKVIRTYSRRHKGELCVV